ncbi:hypothetical protein SAMN02745823_03670 [Sporobacter termitidis DSM 10068]|uniref:ABC-2 family transporter protein n=1 Tax=Sporobacter termitidis DSM 10068 TaxID=1123282 RepID=A0A1M5ZFM6_9FIRM|nr:hypothetical protein [Sporobacter termitidis]SHI23056.1 hypothetical protein SAMN02745823_03670 [Sporobacter termitidis DSM 10068]
MNIPMPDENEKSVAIDAILSKGLIRQKSLGRQLRELHRALGLRSIFRDTADGMLIAAGITLGLCFILFRSFPYSWTGGMLFAVSPVFYLLLSLASEIKERVSGLYELKMTCRYTIRQICVFRMLYFSAAGTAFCVLIAASVSVPGGFRDFWHTLAISLCSLFLCSLLSAKAAAFIGRRRMYYLFPAIWPAICILPVQVFGKAWDQALLRLPDGIALAVVFLTAFFYLREIKKLMTRSEREALFYVNG